MKIRVQFAIFLIAASVINTWATAQNDVKTAARAADNPARAASDPPPAESGYLPSANCRDTSLTPLSRFWELESDSDCGTFTIRGYKPISLSVIGSDSVNMAPTSPTAGHTAPAAPYNTTETRVQISVRTKVAQGLLTGGNANRLDSIWFAYSQQSYWQLFNDTLSRPFRSTDHEPEITYIFPLESALPYGWRLRYAGISANHQSNGQSLPLSRSWNRVILKAGLENGQQWLLNVNLWQRMPEDAATDDNPDISDLVGRAEVSAAWNINPSNTFTAVVRHSLQANANGSIRVGWLRKLSGTGRSADRSGLRFQTEIFSGYGDSLLDYNRRRTVLSLGLTLLDW